MNTGYIKYEASIEVKPGDNLASRMLQFGIWPGSPEPKQGFTLELLGVVGRSSFISCCV